MNTKSGDQLKHLAETGDIGLLYTVIQDDPSILENIDKNQFVETPLHIAARKGHLEFAFEIMNLKPSFATKLNLQGYSPIHLAIDSLTSVASDSPTHLAIDSLTPVASDSPTHLAIDSVTPVASDIPTDLDTEKRQREMVTKLVGINKDLVRVKGREGFTPLHFASKKGEVEFLAEFLDACPDSIEDVNVRGESALHIAVICQQLKALEVLIGWLSKNFKRGARKLEKKILNQKDKDGNTVYHISALSIEPKFLRCLVVHLMEIPRNIEIDIDAKNKRDETAFDLASTQEMKNVLARAKPKNGSKFSNAPTRADELRSKTKKWGKMIIWMRRLRRNISDEQRNTWLIVVTLVATATYESALNPPGGVFQVSASDDNNMKMKSTDSYYSTRGNAGKSILSKNSFAVFSSANLVSFGTSTMIMTILTPSEGIGSQLFVTVLWFAVCYLIALLAISPTHANTIILYILISIFAFDALLLLLLFAYSDYQKLKKLIKSDIRSVVLTKIGSFSQWTILSIVCSVGLLF